MVGEKTVFSRIDPDSRSFQIKGAVDLLSMARIVMKVSHTSGAGMPLTSCISEKHYKCIFLDVGLMQRLLNVHFEEWQRSRTLVDHHRGAIAEQFVGQELLHRSGDHEDPSLFFWHRTARGSQAEVDYLYEAEGCAIPIEVKSGATGHLRSMHQYFQAFESVPGGIKCSLEPMNFSGKIINVPLYAIAHLPQFINYF
jgi:predicted AAA+ superfamily ATPase